MAGIPDGEQISEPIKLFHKSDRQSQIGKSCYPMMRLRTSSIKQNCSRRSEQNLIISLTLIIVKILKLLIFRQIELFCLKYRVPGPWEVGTIGIWYKYILMVCQAPQLAYSETQFDLRHFLKENYSVLKK